MWICTRCSTLWGTYLTHCHASGCSAPLRQYGTNPDDHNHPFTRRYPHPTRDTEPTTTPLRRNTRRKKEEPEPHAVDL